MFGGGDIMTGRVGYQTEGRGEGMKRDGREETRSTVTYGICNTREDMDIEKQRQCGTIAILVSHSRVNVGRAWPMRLR